MVLVLDIYIVTWFAKVNGDLWDLERPLEASCKLELLDFEHPEGMLGHVHLFASDDQ